MRVSIVVVVEGKSETRSVPLLMRRILHEELGVFDVDIRKPVWMKRGQLVKEGGVERAIELARRRPGCQAIMVLLDADDDCPKELAPELLERAQDAAPDLLTSVVLPKREFESWFIGAIESLRGVRGIRADAAPPDDPESKRDAKGWLTGAMAGDRAYVEVDDQPALAAVFDLDLARQRCRSFRKFEKDFGAIVAGVSR